MANYIPENYEPVEVRLEKYWAKYPSGRIETELVSPPANFEQCRYVARVWREASDEHPAATGWAFEIAGGSGANRTNHEENCETSAIGRALANFGFAPLGARPSREEMSKTTRPSAPPAERQPARQPTQSTQVTQPRPQAGPGSMTEAQGRRLWVLAKNQNMTEDDTRAQVFLRFGKHHIHELTKQEASQLMDFIQAGDLLQGSPPPATRTDPQEANQQGYGVPDEPEWMRQAPANDRYTA